jgi:hypothetical protein
MRQDVEADDYRDYCPPRYVEFDTENLPGKSRYSPNQDEYSDQ